MRRTVVQVRGPVDREAYVKLATSLRDEVRVEFVEKYDSSLSREEAVHTDAVICFLPPEARDAHRKCFRFLRQTIDLYPYIPTVVVGAPDDYCRRFSGRPRMTSSFRRNPV